MQLSDKKNTLRVTNKFDIANNLIKKGNCDL